jgi:hypothetical protein
MDEFIEKTLCDIFGWSEMVSACIWLPKPLEEGIANIIQAIEQEIKKEDPTGEKQDKFEHMGDYPEKEWEEIASMRIVALLALKDYAERTWSDYF